MKPVKSYESFDGKIFATAEECADYETFCKKMARIVDTLPRFEMTDEFRAGEEFFQHDLGRFYSVRDAFIKLVLTKYDNELLKGQLGKKDWTFSTGEMFKFFKDMNDQVCVMGWYWIGCIDDKGRQWIHPSIIRKMEGDK